MNEPEIALVLSPERWVEDLHRHCADHGGARVRQLVVDPTLALEEDYGVLVVSHRWPGLTRGLVEALRAGGRVVLGVFDPSEPAAAGHLAGLGLERIVPADAPMTEFVDTVREIAPAAVPRVDRPADITADGDHARVVVVGGPSGAGATEIAIALAYAAGRDAPVVLLDADETTPGIASRLALPRDPNLRIAVDAVEHGLGDVSGATTRVDGIDVVGGLPNPAAWSHVRAAEVTRVVHALGRDTATMVVNVGSRLEDVPAPSHGRYAISRAMVDLADALVAVAVPTPVGVIRLLAWLADAAAITSAVPVHVVVNHAPRQAFVRDEVAEEITRSVRAASMTFVPRDRRVELAAWAGSTVPRGAFTKAIRLLVEAVGGP